MSGKPKYKPLSLDDSLPFGKYRGKTVLQVIDLDYAYILWMYDKAGVRFSPFELNRWIAAGMPYAQLRKRIEDQVKVANEELDKLIRAELHYDDDYMHRRLQDMANHVFNDYLGRKVLIEDSLKCRLIPVFGLYRVRVGDDELEIDFRKQSVRECIETITLAFDSSPNPK